MSGKEATAMDDLDDSREQFAELILNHKQPKWALKKSQAKEIGSNVQRASDPTCNVIMITVLNSVTATRTLHDGLRWIIAINCFFASVTPKKKNT